MQGTQVWRMGSSRRGSGGSRGGSERPLGVNAAKSRPGRSRVGHWEGTDEAGRG